MDLEAVPENLSLSKRYQKNEVKNHENYCKESLNQN